MKATSRELRRKAEKLAAQLGIGFTAAMAMVMEAQAALHASTETTFTAFNTDAGTLIGYVWAALAVTTVGFVYIRLFKKGINKAV